MIDHKIKNIIFDLGGVILDLSVDDTLNAFSKLSGMELEQVRKIFSSSPGFELYEKGFISDSQFRNFIREVFSISATDAQIDQAWNAMLGALPRPRVELLKRLLTSHTVALLSNTNDIHLNHINTVITPTVGQHTLDVFFHKTYYSQRMGMRKPDAEIFEYVLAENRFLAHETLFLDDNKMNVEGARAVGINTVHITTPDLILTYFHE